MAKANREWPLNSDLHPHQEALAAEFTRSSPSPAEKRAFARGWRYGVKSRRLKAEPEPIDPQARQRRDQELQRLNNKITLATRQAATSWQGEIHRLALNYLLQCGGKEHFNMTRFIEEVRALPEVQRYYRAAGQARPLSANAIRTVLNERVGIVGKPGRKKNVI